MAAAAGRHLVYECSRKVEHDFAHLDGCGNEGARAEADKNMEGGHKSDAIARSFPGLQSFLTLPGHPPWASLLGFLPLAS